MNNNKPNPNRPNSAKPGDTPRREADNDRKIDEPAADAVAAPKTDTVPDGKVEVSRPSADFRNKDQRVSTR